MKNKLILTMVLAAFLLVSLVAASNHTTEQEPNMQNNDTNETMNITTTTENMTVNDSNADENMTVNGTTTVLEPGNNQTQQNNTTNQTQEESDVEITTSISNEVWSFLGVLLSLIVVVSLITYVRNHGGMPWTRNMEKARNLHKRAQKLHRNGKEDKAKKLYERAKNYRESEV